MFVPAAALAVVSVAVALLPGLPHRLAAAAVQFRDTAGYAADVLGTHAPAPEALEPLHFWTSSGLLTSGLGAVGALLVAAFSLWGRRLAAVRASARVVAPLRRLHSGHIGDYVTWVAVGIGVVAGLLAAA
jgi:multicomponent Na+:H+ antiporter subunit D